MQRAVRALESRQRLHFESLEPRSLLAADAFDAWDWWDASSSGDDLSWDWTWAGSDDQWAGDAGWDWGDESWFDSGWMDDGTSTGDPDQADSGKLDVVEPDVSPITAVSIAPDALVPGGAGEAPAGDSAAGDAVAAVVVVPPGVNAPAGDSAAGDAAAAAAVVVVSPGESAPDGSLMDPETVDPPALADDGEWAVDAEIGSDDLPTEDDQLIAAGDLDAVVSGDLPDPLEGHVVSGGIATGLPQPGPSVAGHGTHQGPSSASIATAGYDRVYAILSAAFSQFGSEAQDLQPAGWNRKSPRR